ncbi:MAG: selenide, water dikinase SelD [Pseudomonadales bacterium]
MMDLVLLGGGHSHVILLRMLGMRPLPGLQVTLISPDVRSAYSGMLPGVIAGHYSPDDIHIELVPLCRFAGARFIKANVSDIDPVARLVPVPGRPDLHYDLLSIDIGITPDLNEIKGAAEQGIAVKPINEFLAKWQAFETSVARRVGVVGAGAGGVELCLAIHHRLTNGLGRKDLEMHLFCDGPEVLSGYPHRVQQQFRHHLSKRGIECHTGYRAVSYEDHTLVSMTGQSCQLEQAFFVTQAASQPWLQDTGLELDEDGFIAVRTNLLSMNFDNVFAVGDIARVIDDPRPKAGVYAVRQGPPLYRNIRRLIAGKRARPFSQQKDFLSLITTGDKYAIATRNGLSAEGRWVWHWKNWIDHRFMNRFNHLPAMKESPDDPMHCGGCGSKVSGDLLREVLAGLNVAQSQMDDAAIYDVPAGQVILQTVDAFRAFIDDPYLFAKVAVHHALSDIYAMAGTPANALAIVTLPYAPADKTRQLLTELLAGALAALASEGVELVGGHTSEGPELSLGFSVTGIGTPATLLHKGGAMAGDVLVLTKPLGTGALFAADMRSKAKGAWTMAALDSMLLSNQAAMAILRDAGANACTDITGFGLGGHLQEMLLASSQTEAMMGAALELDGLPILSGAMEVMAGGIYSELHEGNRRSVQHLKKVHHPNFEILFDPQTSGGLLAAIPSTTVEGVIEALIGAGYTSAARVGVVVSADVPGSLTCR